VGIVRGVTKRSSYGWNWNPLAYLSRRVAYRELQAINPFKPGNWTYPGIMSRSPYLKYSLPPACSVNLTAASLTLNECVDFSIFLADAIDVANVKLDE
jgi:hypothetical protein